MMDPDFRYEQLLRKAAERERAWREYRRQVLRVRVAFLRLSPRRLWRLWMGGR